MYHNKNYLDDETKNQIDKKGFSVYNYISIKELLLTINKDYLEALNLLNIPLIIILLIISFFVYDTKNYVYFTYTFITIYSLIFTYLIIKLAYRTYKFSKITNIIYTKKGLVLGHEIFDYKDDEKIYSLLLQYQSLFDEYLSKPSNLKNNISLLRKKLLIGLKENYKFLAKTTDDLRVTVGGFVLLSVYSISIFIFYYLGLLLGFILFFFFAFFINSYFKIDKSIELKIKESVSIIEDEIKNLEDIYALLENKIKNFKDGEISNLSKNIENEFNSFYKKINLILIQKDKLKGLIDESIYKDFIDFQHFALHVRDHFNTPLKSMITILEEYKIRIDIKIEEAKIVLENITSSEKYQIENKLVTLETINKSLQIHLNQLKNSLQ